MDQKKSLLEVALMPLVIAVVGVIGTLLITRQQIVSAKAISDSQSLAAQERASAEQKVKILEIFKEKIASDRPTSRQAWRGRP